MNDPVTGLPVITIGEICRRFQIADSQKVMRWLSDGGFPPSVPTPGGFAVRYDNFLQCFKLDAKMEE